MPFTVNSRTKTDLEYRWAVNKMTDRQLGDVLTTLLACTGICLTDHPESTLMARDVDRALRLLGPNADATMDKIRAAATARTS